MAITVTFDDWDFTDADVTIADVNLSLPEPSNSQKSARAYGSVVQEISSGGLRILITGQITGTSASDFSANKKSLLINTSGLTRNRHGRLSLRSGFHYWAARAGGVTLNPLDGVYQAQFAMEFLASDPWERSNTEISAAIVSSTGNISHPTQFAGDAPVMPVRIDCGAGWAAGEVFILENSTAGYTFSKIIEQSLGSGETLVVDAELGRVYEGSRLSNVGVGGRFPYLQGNTTNSFDRSASSRTPTMTFTFWDRYSPS